MTFLEGRAKRANGSAGLTGRTISSGTCRWILFRREGSVVQVEPGVAGNPPQRGANVALLHLESVGFLGEKRDVSAVSQRIFIF